MDHPQDKSSEELGKAFCRDLTFWRGVVRVEDLPSDAEVELAFAGRSNVGKSSLINALAGYKKLAFASNTPGRTQEINFFAHPVQAGRYIVDLPGYGYAKAPKGKVDNWNDLIHDYIRGRIPLKRLFVLIDARHGLMKTDIPFLEFLDKAGVVYQLILTKMDKIGVMEQQQRLADVTAALKKHPAAFPEVLMVSSVKKTGLEAVWVVMHEQIR
jgi:GTP-binding protein